MARVTVEDCLKFVKNRFDLVIKASKRAHALEMGAVDPMVDVENDKPTVVALREIAAGFDVSKLKRDENEVIKMDELEEGLLEAADADAEARQEKSSSEEVPKEAKNEDDEEKPLPKDSDSEN